MTLENVHGFYTHSAAWLPDLGIGCGGDDLFWSCVCICRFRTWLARHSGQRRCFPTTHYSLFYTTLFFVLWSVVIVVIYINISINLCACRTRVILTQPSILPCTGPAPVLNWPLVSHRAFHQLKQESSRGGEMYRYSIMLQYFAQLIFHLLKDTK